MEDKKLQIRCVGSGIYCLDTIVVDGKVTLEEVGGTCGNVMCILAHLGLDTYPQASLDESPEGFKIKADLERYGCDTRFVTNTPDGGTTLLRVTHRRNPDGTPKISDIVKFSGENILSAAQHYASESVAFMGPKGNIGG